MSLVARKVWMRGRAAGFKRLGGDIDVIAKAAAKAGDPGSADLRGDALHGFKISLGSDGKSGLDDVDAEALQLAGNDQLFLGVHATAG